MINKSLYAVMRRENLNKGSGEIEGSGNLQGIDCELSSPPHRAPCRML